MPQPPMPGRDRSDLLVSVVVPTFDRAGLLAETLGSVVAQTYRPLELVVVDDGSRDATAQVVAAVEESPGLSVRSLVQDRHGAQAARNRGLAESRGELVLFLDSDDLLLPGALAAATAVLRSEPAIDVLYGDWLEGSALSDARAGSLGPVSDMVEALLLRQWCPPFAYLWRRAALPAGCWDEAVTTNQDFDQVLRRAIAGCRFAHHPEAMGLYRCHDQVRTSRRSGREWAYQTTRILGRAEGLLDTAGKLWPSRLAALADYHWVIAKTVALSEPELAAHAAATARRLVPGFLPRRRHERLLARVLGLGTAAKLLSAQRAPRRLRPP